MPPFASEGRAALLVQVRWRTEPSAPPTSREELFRECARMTTDARERIRASLPSATVEGSLALAPLLLVSCGAAKAAVLARELRGWEQVERVEEVLPEPENPKHPFVPPAPRASNSHPIVGFADIGRPNLESPLLHSLLQRRDEDFPYESHGEKVRGGHSTAVLATFLQALEPDDPPHCVIESLSRDAGPFAWLAALDRLLCRGAAVVNLSYGRLPLERERGWGALEWGTELLCRSTGAIVVAAAGRLDPELHLGRRLYLPASAPHVLCADEMGRTGKGRAKGEGEKVFLASRAHPDGGRPGSSYSTPRIVARVVDALRALPPRFHAYESLVALLLASARPHASDVLSPGSVDRDRLREIVEAGRLLRGASTRSLVLPHVAGIPLRVALAWRDLADGARLIAPCSRRLYRLRRAAQWVVMDYLPGDSRLHVARAGGPWAVAWAPLMELDLRCFPNAKTRRDARLARSRTASLHQVAF